MKLLWTLLAGLALVACGDKAEDAEQGHGGSMPGMEKEGMDDVAAGLAKLSAADRKIAEAQKVCPVSGEMLGSMGMPVKMEAQGVTVFLCCPDCKKEFQSDPAKYIAKVQKK